MKPVSLVRAALMALPLVLLPAASPAQGFSDAQRREIEKIVRDYLLANPELIGEVLQELEKKQAQFEADRHKAAIKEHAQALFNSPLQVTLGNPQGDVTMVEFFDYNCGYCKRALSDMMELMRADPKLRFVLKEYPVLGDGSRDAARVSIAARMQDKGGKKFLDFHQKLLGTRTPIDRARAIAAAKEAGLDVARIEKDLTSSEIDETLRESFRLADALAINGTPSYVVGEEVVIGAVGLAALREKVAGARR
jgi:protein-disulfide isomerase